MHKKYRAIRVRLFYDQQKFSKLCLVTKMMKVAARKYFNLGKSLTSVQLLPVLLSALKGGRVWRRFHLEADLVALHVDVAQHRGALDLHGAELKEVLIRNEV